MYLITSRLLKSTLLLVLLVACQKKQTGTNQTDPLTAPGHSDNTHTDTPGPSPDNFIVLPGEQVGAINPTATEASLIQLLGAENVRRDTIYVAEGTYEIGTTLYKNTADQAQILWTDKTRFASPATVILRPARDENNRLIPGTAGPTCQWTTPQGVTPGATLIAIETINGKPFSLYGFDWDFGGKTTNWHGGALAGTDGKTYLSLGFAVEENLSARQVKLYESVLGDQEFRSDNKTLSALNPTVETMAVFFR